MPLSPSAPPLPSSPIATVVQKRINYDTRAFTPRNNKKLWVVELTNPPAKCMINTYLLFLQQAALSRLDSLGLGVHDGAYRLIKHSLETLLREGRALKILGAINLLRHGMTLGVRDGLNVAAGQLLERLLVVTEIDLGANQQHRRVGTVVANLRVPLVAYILKRGR